MPAHERARHPFLAPALAALLAGCAGARAPYDWPDRPEETAYSIHGSWVDFDTCGVSRTVVQKGRDEWGDPLWNTVRRGCRHFGGELLAAARDTLWILEGDLLRVVPVGSISDGVVTYFNAGGTEGWTVVGCFSTLSNGFGLALTLPLWIVTGVFSANSRTQEAEIPVTLSGVGRLSRWARFPQGLPPGLDVRLLKPKPKGVRPTPPYMPKTLR